MIYINRNVSNNNMFPVYYDSYKYDAFLANKHTRGKLGYATKETLTVFGDDTKG